MKTQVKLLRVLQERSFRRLGGSDLIEVDVRLITATNRDLLRMVEQGTFRSDLYYRLNVVNIHLPPLRERREDIPLLVAHFMAKYNLEFNKKFERVREAALGMMLDYQWAGTVRELENVIERAVVIGQGSEIGPEHLPFCRPEVATGEESETLESVERRHIERMLSRQQWNIAKTARILGIDRTTLHKKIKKLNLRNDTRTA
jgi:transcriptional regulator with PAS, ATPase and Fis domain